MNITLIGMPASGKSTLGRVLAKRWNMDFIDTDKIMEKKSGIKLSRLIEDIGEKRFLALEKNTVLALKNIENAVICPGGSVIYSFVAMRFLKKISRIIFLDIALSRIEKRINQGQDRGVIGAKDKALKQLYQERVPLYEKFADLKLRMSADENMEKDLEKISRMIRSRT